MTTDELNDFLALNCKFQGVIESVRRELQEKIEDRDDEYDDIGLVGNIVLKTSLARLARLGAGNVKNNPSYLHFGEPCDDCAFEISVRFDILTAEPHERTRMINEAIREKVEEERRYREDRAKRVEKCERETLERLKEKYEGG